MAEVSTAKNKSCNNCDTYFWTQPTDQDSIKKCSRCKFISYCSKECQKEHWEKVHKHQCKYLAGDPVRPKARYHKANCLVCQLQAETGTNEMSRKDNPVLGCILPDGYLPTLYATDNIGGPKFPIPFQLGEMTGKFKHKIEHTVNLMMRVINKMSLTAHPVCVINQKDFAKMMSMLTTVRFNTWEAYTYCNPGHWLDRWLPSSLSEDLDKVGLLVNMINEKLEMCKFSDQSVFRAWDTFNILLSLLQSFTGFKMKEVENVGLPDVHPDLQKIITPSVQFNFIWEELLNSMSNQMVPYTILLKILCGGTLEHACGGCSKVISVTQVTFTIDQSWDYFQVPTCLLGDITFFSCGDLRCLAVANTNINLLSSLTSKFHSDNFWIKCDFCALPSRAKIHRCTRCLTKQYCGVGCRDQDWIVVHKMVCRTGEVERKRKGGKDKRKEFAEKSVEESLQYMKSKLNIS